MIALLKKRGGGGEKAPGCMNACMHNMEGKGNVHSSRDSHVDKIE